MYYHRRHCYKKLSEKTRSSPCYGYCAFLDPDDLGDQTLCHADGVQPEQNDNSNSNLLAQCKAHGKCFNLNKISLGDISYSRDNIEQAN